MNFRQQLKVKLKEAFAEIVDPQGERPRNQDYEAGWERGFAHGYTCGYYDALRDAIELFDANNPAVDD